MASDKAALLEVREAMRAAGVEDRVRTAAQTMYQALTDALTAVIGGVHLVITDAHTGLENVIESVLTVASWQRCSFHFLGNVLAQVPKGRGHARRLRRPRGLRRLPRRALEEDLVHHSNAPWPRSRTATSAPTRWPSPSS